jgi:thiosulfate/3-mercaptopyruvate sulfurtransferase
VTLADVRFSLTGPPGRKSYLDGHVPGAHYVDLDTELAGTPGARGRHPLPEVAVFGAAMRRIGVRPEVPVVCCDGAGGTVAARLWWMLTDAGHPDVRVLDGGFAAWAAAGYAVSTAEEPPPGDGTFRPRPGQRPRLDADAAAELARTGTLLDARAGERYRGEQEPVDPRAGHIPGAVSAPTSQNLGPDGRFAAPEALRERFARLGATSGETVGAYCGSGVSAAHEVLALTLAGYGDVALYPGSWSEWSSDPSRPVAP